MRLLDNHRARQRAWLLRCLLIIILSLLTTACVRNDHGTLHYSGPTEESIAVGQTLQGTNVRYVRETPDGAELLIDDQRAVKRIGDFVGWQGSLGRDFQADLGLRVVYYTADKVQLAGTADLTINNASPVPGAFPEKPIVAYRVPVTYNIARGDTIPGTTLTYEGKTEQGARIGGLPPGDYPYRQAADSLVWSGRLADGALLRVDLRVVIFTEQRIQLAGIATLAAG